MDYEDLVKEWILLAAMIYRCLLSMEDAFPDLAVESDMVKEAWATVINETSGPPLTLTPDIAKIVSNKLLLGDILIVFQIKARGSQAHGEIKDKTRPFIRKKNNKYIYIYILYSTGSMKITYLLYCTQ